MGYLKPVLSSSIPHSFSRSSLVSSPGRCLTVRFRWYAPCDLASSLNEGFVVSVEHGMITTKGLPNSRSDFGTVPTLFHSLDHLIGSVGDKIRLILFIYK